MLLVILDFRQIIFLAQITTFPLDNNLDVLKYNSLDAKFSVNNFITSFKYLEENDNIGDDTLHTK